MKKKTKIIGGIVAFGIIGNLLGFGEDEEKEIKAEPAKVEAIAVEENPVEKVKPIVEESTYQYEIFKNFIENDPSAYSGRAVYEVEIFAEFDLEAKSLKKDVEKIIEKEAEIALQEKPNSVMIRVAVYQGTKTEFEILPVASRTFDVNENKLEKRFLQYNQKFPLLESMRNK